MNNINSSLSLRESFNPDELKDKSILSLSEQFKFTIKPCNKSHHVTVSDLTSESKILINVSKEKHNNFFAYNIK